MYINFDGDFRQVVLKLANTYTPDFELPNHFENRHDYLDAVASAISRDFQKKLYQELYSRLDEILDSQLN